MTNRSRIAAAGAFLLVLACGSSNDGGPSLTISPPSQTVTASGAAVNFTATLNGSTNAISWSLTGPGSITPATGTSTAYTPPASVASATTATLTATAGSLTSSATITINPPAAITVAGKVIDNNLRPLAGATIIIGAQNTASDSTGHFSISNVTPPYDLIGFATTPTKIGVLYKALTRPDPTILVPESKPAPNSGTVTGALSGGDPLGTAGEQTEVAWGSPETPFFGPTSSVSSNPYTLTIQWGGPTSTTGTIHALQWAVSGNLPTSYKGYGTKTSVGVSNSATTLNADIAMSAPSASSVGGTITAPAGLTIANKSLAIAFADNATISLGSDSSSSTSFSYPFPGNTGGNATVAASASSAGGDVAVQQLKGIAPGTSNVSIAIPTPVSAITPADSGTGITTSTDFTWAPLTGGVHILEILGPGSSPSYYVFTAAATAKIPDLSGQGLGLPAATMYNWQVLAVGPWTSVDQIAGDTSILPTGNTLNESITANRTFTTQ
jgi:hypothetical protein